MEIFNRFYNPIKIKGEFKNLIHDEIRKENNRRVLILAIIAIPISIIHIILFYSQLSESSGVEFKWRTGIIFSHFAIIAGLSFISFISHFFSKKKYGSTTFSNIAVHLLMIFLLGGGAIIATIDQLVTNSITPFFVTCIIGSIVILMKPIQSIIYYTASYVVFYYLITITQKDPNILSSNHVNGITIVGVGICLSVIFWRNYILRLKQDKLIEKQKKELETNLEKLTYFSNELKESNATKDKLFSLIAHDLKSPLSSVIGITELSPEIIEEMSMTEIKNIFFQLNKEAHSSIELINKLHEWSISQLKKIYPSIKKIPLRHIIQESIESTKNLSNSKNIEITNCVNENYNIFADYSMSHSILKNIIMNSLKFTKREGKIEIEAHPKNGMIEIIISDNGIGIKADQLNNLFKLTNQKVSYGTENEKGTGLGLQICKEFVELNNGEIWANSTFGVGTSFHILLPSK